MITGELYMLSPELLNASFSRFLRKKKNQKTSKEPQYIPKWTPGSEVVDTDCWTKLCAEYKDLFEEPGTPVKTGYKNTKLIC